MKKTLAYSFKNSIPIFISFVPVGLAYGILMSSAGFKWYWTTFASATIFAGSLQMVIVAFLGSAVPLATVAITALLLNSRVMFYGIPFIEKWRGYGLWKGFLIFSLIDETFSMHVAMEAEEGINEKWAFIFNGLLVYLYWLVLATAGSLIGSLITFDTTGVDFAMTAMFIVILMEQMKGAKSILPFWIAAVSSVLCLLLIGPDGFILPSLAVTVAALILFREKIEEVQE